MQLNKNWLIILCMILIIPFSVQGAVLGFTDAKIQSNYFINNELAFDRAWVISWVADDYTSSSVNAYLSKDDIKDISGIDTKQGISITANTKNTECIYDFDVNKARVNQVFNIEYISTTIMGGTSYNTGSTIKWVNENCMNFDSKDLKYYTTSYSDIRQAQYIYRNELVIASKFYCIKKRSTLGIAGGLSNPFNSFSTEFSVQADGKDPEDKLITNSDTGSLRNTKIGDNTWIQWQGNLATGQSCPNENNYMGIHSQSLGGWRLINKNNYDKFVSEIPGLSLSIERWALGKQNKEFLENRFNTIANNVLIKENLNYNVINNNIDKGKLAIQLNKILVFPLFRLIVNADYLELVETAGIPKIVRVDDIKFNEGKGDGVVEVLIKNIGQSQGGFSARIIDCSNDFRGIGSTGTGVLLPGEQKTIKLLVSGSSTADKSIVSGKCTVEVKDSLNPDAIDTKTFNIEMTQIVECDPNELVCNTALSGVLKCNAQGTGYTIVEECSKDEICRSGKCVTKGGTEDKDDGKFNANLLIITIILALIGGGIFYGYTLPFAKTKALKITFIVLSIAIAVGIFILIPTLWKSIISLFSFNIKLF